MNAKLLIGVGVALAAIWYFFLRKKEPQRNPALPEGDFREAATKEIDMDRPGTLNLTDQLVGSLKKIKDEFGVDVAEMVEKIYRLETAHFTSGQFKKTFSPGMEKHKSEFPFGWTSMKDYWNSINFVPDFHRMPENKTGIAKTFVKFPNVFIPMRGLALYVKKYSPERWYSTDPVKQAEYRNSLAGIKAKIVNKLRENG